MAIRYDYAETRSVRSNFTDTGQINTVFGESLDGNKICHNFSKNNGNILITGFSGSGKTVLLDLMIVDIMNEFIPEQVKLVYLDFKMSVHMFEGPYFLYAPHMDDTRDAAKALKELDKIWESYKSGILTDKLVIFIDEITALQHMLTQNQLSRYIDVLLPEVLSEGHKYGVSLVISDLTFHSMLSDDIFNKFGLKIVTINSFNEYVFKYARKHSVKVKDGEIRHAIAYMMTDVGGGMIPYKTMFTTNEDLQNVYKKRGIAYPC